MSDRLFARTALAALLLVLTVSVLVAVQRRYEAAKETASRPDLQGIWNFATLTPLERSPALAGRATFTDDELARLKADDAEPDESRRGRPVGDTLPSGGNYNTFWLENGTATDKRTSLIVDPSDGRIPPLTLEAQQRRADRETALRISAGPEDRDAAERCILGFNSGPPMVPGAYNQNVQIIQTGDVLVIVNEMVHNARIVPLDGRPHLPSNLRLWAGDSRGRWEEETLVVDTTNFTDKSWMGRRWNQGIDDNLHLIERFTRADAGTLLYEFTIDDPTTFTKPWTTLVRMKKISEPIYEYACHEANYGLSGILAGARLQQKRSSGPAR